MYDFSKIDPRRIVYMNIFLMSNRQQLVTDNAMKVITAKQWVALMMLPMFPAPPTLSQLAEICNTSHQNMKQIILKLERSGFVTITKDSADRRAIRISATEKFLLFKQDFEVKTVDFMSKMFSGFEEQEIAQLNASLDKLYKNLEVIKNEYSNTLHDDDRTQ